MKCYRLSIMARILSSPLDDEHMLLYYLSLIAFTHKTDVLNIIRQYIC